MIQEMQLDRNQDEWPSNFAAARLDVIPDPMVMRIADLFIGGKGFATARGLETDKVWRAIEGNLDGLIAFFHLLMTRDRIPLIDYEYTFDATNFDALGDVAVVLHPPIYADVKEQAKLKLSKIDLNRIPLERREEMAQERDDEFRAVGFDWFPDPGEQFVAGDKLLGTLLLGGLIFGSYAQLSGSGHILQPTRKRLLLELTQPDDAPLWGARQEAALFKRLTAVVAEDPRLSEHDTQLPPTILHFLLGKQLPSPRHLLDEALKLSRLRKNG